MGLGGQVFRRLGGSLLRQIPWFGGWHTRGEVARGIAAYDGEKRILASRVRHFESILRLSRFCFGFAHRVVFVRGRICCSRFLGDRVSVAFRNHISVAGCFEQRGNARKVKK